MSSNQRIFATILIAALLMFVFRDQIGVFSGDEMTSDTEVVWNSCEVTEDAHGAHFTFLRCTEPTMVWMIYSEDAFGSPYGIEEFKLRADAQHLSSEVFEEFKKAHQLSADMTNTSEQVVLGGQRMLWDEVYAQEIRKKNKFADDEILGHGILATRFEPGTYRVLGCVSQTDSDILCENAGTDLLYTGLDATLGR